MTETPQSEPEHKGTKVEISIDGESFTASAKEMTARAILALASKDAAAYYLVEIKGKKERVSYKDRPDTVIKLHKGSKFITVSTGETPVS